MNIQIVYGDKRKQSFSIQKTELTIGRDKSNDIVLEDPKVSRQHAQISFDGTQYQVKDLESTNKTFLEGEPLLPNVVYTLEPGKVLRIGRNYLRLLVEEAQAQPAPDQEGQSVPPAPAEQIGLHLENPRLEVEPGGSVPVGITLSNPSERVDHYKISLEGIPPQWIPTLPPITRLMPHDQQEVNLVIQPPRHPEARAGLHEFSVVAQSQTDPRLVVKIPASLNIHPYSQFNCSLAPQKLRAGDTARISIHNLGNQAEDYRLTVQDRANELRFEPSSAQVKIKEGESAGVDIRPLARQNRWVGNPQLHPFSAQVIPLGGEPQTVAGEAVSQARIPAWVPPVGLILLAGLCLLLWQLISKPPVIKSFEPAANPVLLGSPATLSWEIQNGQTAILNPGNIQVSSGKGSYQTEALTEERTYTLEARNLFGSVTKEQTVGVKK